MNPDNSEKAINLTRRARTQSKHAARNLGKAAHIAAEPVLEEVQGGVEKAVDLGKDWFGPIKRLNQNHLGHGILALSVATGAAALAFLKFRDAYIGHTEMLDTIAKTGHHIIPSEPTL